jgi:hypothetical protein
VRTEKLEVRATAEEMARYQAAARYHAMSLSAWVRMLLEAGVAEVRVTERRHNVPISRDFADR